MKRSITQAVAVGSMLSAIAFLPTAAIAEYKCDNALSTIDQRACAKAAEGPDALRSFVSRTKTIWDLYYWDYARRDEPGTAAAASMKPGLATDAAPQTAVATAEMR